MLLSASLVEEPDDQHPPRRVMRKSLHHFGRWFGHELRAKSCGVDETEQSLLSLFAKKRRNFKLLACGRVVAAGVASESLLQV